VTPTACEWHAVGASLNGQSKMTGAIGMVKVVAKELSQNAVFSVESKHWDIMFPLVTLILNV